MSNTGGKSKTKSSSKSKAKKESEKLTEMFAHELDKDSETTNAMPYENIYTSQNKVADFKTNRARLVSALCQMFKQRDRAAKRANNATRASEKDKIERLAQEELEKNLAVILDVHGVGASAVAKHTKHFADYATIGDESVDSILEEMNDHAKAFDDDYTNKWMSVRAQSIIRASISNHLKAFNAVSSAGGFTYTDISSCQVLRYYPTDFLDLVDASAAKFSTRTMNLPRETRDAIKSLDSSDTPVSDKYDSLTRDWFAQAPYLKDTRTLDGTLMTTRMVQHILTCMIRHAEIEKEVMVYKTCGNRNRIVDQFEVPIFDFEDENTRALGIDLIDTPDNLFPPKEDGEEGKIDKPPRNVYIIEENSILGRLIKLANRTSKTPGSATWEKMYMNRGRFVYKSSSLSNDLEMRLRGDSVADRTDALSTAVNQYLNMTNMKVDLNNATDKTKALQESQYVLIREALGKDADVRDFNKYYDQVTAIFQSLAMLSVACEVNKHIYEGKKIYNTKERVLTGRTKKKYSDGTKSSKRGKNKSGDEEEDDSGSASSDSDETSSSDEEDEDNY